MKTDYDLGLAIHELLKDNNLENAVNWQAINLWSDNSHLKQLEDYMRSFIQGLGLDLTDQSLAMTPQRLVKLFVEDLFWGLDYKNFPAVGADVNAFNYSSPIISQGIKLCSTCEHHFVAIKGYVTIAYIPGQQLIGLGKLNQIVNFFAHRPQIQERLTKQILLVLQYILGVKDVAVSITAMHDCISRRNLNGQSNKVTSIELGGKFLNDTLLTTYFSNQHVQVNHV